MLDGQRQRVDIPVYARTAHNGPLQKKRLEGDLCGIVRHVPAPGPWWRNRSRDWTELDWTALAVLHRVQPLACPYTPWSNIPRSPTVRCSQACGSLSRVLTLGWTHTSAFHLRRPTGPETEVWSVGRTMVEGGICWITLRKRRVGSVDDTLLAVMIAVIYRIWPRSTEPLLCARPLRPLSTPAVSTECPPSPTGTGCTLWRWVLSPTGIIITPYPPPTPQLQSTLRHIYLPSVVLYTSGK